MCMLKTHGKNCYNCNEEREAAKSLHVFTRCTHACIVIRVLKEIRDLFFSRAATGHPENSFSHAQSSLSKALRAKAPAPQSRLRRLGSPPSHPDPWVLLPWPRRPRPHRAWQEWPPPGPPRGSLPQKAAGPAWAPPGPGRPEGRQRPPRRPKAW